MENNWDEIGFVISSRYRIQVLDRLADGPATPSRIATDRDLSISHVSRALQSLRQRDLVTLLVPEDRKKGRVYGITDRGENIWEEIKSEQVTELGDEEN